VPYARNCLVLTLCLVLLADKPAAGQTAPQHRENGKPERVDKYGDALPEGAIVRLGTTRLRHEGEAHALAFSPDGKSLACADTRHRTTLWEVQSGKRSRALLTPYEVLTLAYSPDGKLLAAGGDHGQISVWDIATGARLSEFKVDRRRTLTSRVETLAFGPDGKVLYLQAESLNRSALIVAEAATGRRIRKLVERDALLWSFALSPDSERIAVPASTGTIDILNTRTGGKACTIYSDWPGDMMASGAE
jgi:WD40 repeat protein